nr:uncharacterized protein LOC117227750 [Megalopta genalis]
MGFRVTPRIAIAFTKASVALTCAWPPSLSATKAELLFFKVLWCAAFTSSIGLLLPLFNAICEYYNEPIILGKNVSLFAAVAQVTIKMVVCRLMQQRFRVSHSGSDALEQIWPSLCQTVDKETDSERTRFQRLFFDLETFCRHATEEENVVLQRHVDRYKYSHGIYTACCFLTSIFVICGPLYSPQDFPTHAKYPFPVEHQPVRGIIFLHQALVGFQASAGMAIDAQIALLLRFATARFEILGTQLDRARSESEFNACIEKHTRLLSCLLFIIILFTSRIPSTVLSSNVLFTSISLYNNINNIYVRFSRRTNFRYTKSIYTAVKFIVLATAITTNLAVIFGSLNLITRQPLTLKILYALVVVSASGELFVYSWSADSLVQQTTYTGTKAYDTDWFQLDAKLQKKVYFMIFRSQKCEAIQISGLLPQISLSYYAKVGP